MEQFRSLCLGIALTLLATGCGPPPVPDRMFEGRWVRYHYWADEGPPCGEAVAQMDRFVELLGAYFQRPPPVDSTA